MNESAKKTLRTAVRELNKPVTMLMMLIAAFSDSGGGDNGSDDDDSVGEVDEAKQTACEFEQGMIGGVMVACERRTRWSVRPAREFKSAALLPRKSMWTLKTLVLV